MTHTEYDVSFARDMAIRLPDEPFETPKAQPEAIHQYRRDRAFAILMAVSVIIWLVILLPLP
jgi:hypothetical protein